MLRVTVKPIVKSVTMLSAVKLSVVVLGAVAPSFDAGIYGRLRLHLNCLIVCILLTAEHYNERRRDIRLKGIRQNGIRQNCTDQNDI
jgi:hypothetical protein